MRNLHHFQPIFEQKCILYRLARILHEGLGFYGQAAKAGWEIARGQICREQICMSEASPKGKGRTPVVIIAIAMDQGGLFKMRRQIAHKTTRTKCNLANPDYFAVTDCKNYKYSSL